jgi:hypothetical protein
MTDKQEKKLDKIIEQQNYIIALLEEAVDDAHLVKTLQERLNRTRQAMRELEYQQWFEGHKTTCDPTKKEE